MTEIELTRRRIVAGFLVIGLAAAAAGVGTFALFSDEAASDSNINAGSLDLEAVNGNYTVDNLFPTQSTGNHSLTTNYTGQVNSTLTVNISTDNPDFADQLDVESAVIIVDGQTVNSITSGTVADLDTYGEYILNNGDEVEFKGNFTLGSDTGNSYQGDSVNVTVTFNATQQT